MHLDWLSVLRAVDLPGSAGQRDIPGFDAVAGLGGHLPDRLVLLEGLADRGASGHGLAGLRHEGGVPLVVVEQPVDVAGVECLGIAAVEVFGSRYLHRPLLWSPELSSVPLCDDQSRRRTA